MDICQVKKMNDDRWLEDLIKEIQEFINENSLTMLDYRLSLDAACTADLRHFDFRQSLFFQNPYAPEIRDKSQTTSHLCS